MINFFRTIRNRLLREGKTTRYLTYAIGEIILVVIGILIALQINNWNEHRKSMLVEDERLINLLEGLRTDSTSFSQSSQDIKQIDKIHEQLYAIGVKGAAPDSLGDIQLIRRLMRHHLIAKANDPLITNKISDETIRKEISIYFNQLTDLDMVYDQFYYVIHDRMRIYLGEHGLYDLEARFEKPMNGTDWINREGLITLSKTEEFQQILFEANLKLDGLTRELKTVSSQNQRLKQMILDKLGDKAIQMNP